MLNFTFEEEFKVVDYIVRIEQYQNRRFDFVVSKFHQYKEITGAFVALTHVGRKIPFSLQLERKLFIIGLEFTKMQCKVRNTNVLVPAYSSDCPARKLSLNGSFSKTYQTVFTILTTTTTQNQMRR